MLSFLYLWQTCDQKVWFGTPARLLRCLSWQDTSTCLIMPFSSLEYEWAQLDCYGNLVNYLGKG